MKEQSLPTLAAALVLALGGAAAAPAFAQTTPRRTLSLEGARRVITAAVDAAARTGAGGAIAVVDEGGHLLAFERLDGTFAAASTVSVGKARTAALFRKPTSFFEEVVTKHGRTSMVALPDFTPLQGGVPIVVGGEVVGAVGVSGAHSAAEDEEIAVAAAAAVKDSKARGDTAAPARDVVVLPANDVAAAFAKGAPLLEVAGFKIHASRRDAPGTAEIHTRDTDIVYVLDGTATLVTGGTVRDAKETAPGELRGGSIDGGEPRRLARGDVVVVPSGVPHWFRDVSAPFTYYVVKVTDAACCGDAR